MRFGLHFSLLLARGVAGRIEGEASDRLLVTIASDPPTIASVHLKTHELSTEHTYTKADVLGLGVSIAPAADGREPPLRPHGITLLEHGNTDTIFWTDAGVGAIFSLRFDSSPMSLVIKGLHTPEAVLIDSTRQTAALGPYLYWADSGTNRIQRCRLTFALGVTAGCPSGPTDLVTGAQHVAGLAIIASRTGTHDSLYYAEAISHRIFVARVEESSATVTSRTELVPYVAIPTALSLEPRNGTSNLWWMYQKKPTGVSRLWLDGRGTELITYGLARPRCVAFSKEDLALLVDSGTRRITVGKASAGAEFVTLYEGGADFEPRDCALRRDAQTVVPVDPTKVVHLDSAATRMRGHQRDGAAATAVACVLALAALQRAARTLRPGLAGAG